MKLLLFLLLFTGPCLAQLPNAPTPQSNIVFYTLTGANIGMTTTDLMLAQNCIDMHTCKEGNFLMPKSEPGRIVLAAGVTAGVTWASNYLRKHNNKLWWLAPVAGIAAHTLGTISDLKYQ